MKQVIIKLEGMRCEMCESHICDCIRNGNPEAKKVKASHRKGEASFLLEDDEQFENSLENIKKDGYTVLSFEQKPYEKKGFFSFFCKK